MSGAIKLKSRCAWGPLLVILALMAICPLRIIAQSRPVLPSEAGHAASDRARVLFGQGVDFANAEDWASAVHRFESSFALEKKVSTAFNIVVAYERLGAWAAAARAAEEFFSIADKERHADQWEQAMHVQSEASGRVAQVRLEITPADARVTVDGELVEGAFGAKLWLDPGEHEFVIQSSGFVEQRFRWMLEGGVVAARVVVLEANALADEAVEDPPTDRLHIERAGGQRVVGAGHRPSGSTTASVEPQRRVLAYVGGTGALVAVGAGLGLYIGAVAQADALSSQDPYDSGFLSRAEHYRKLRAWSAAATVGGGALLLLSGLAYADTTDRSWEYYLAAGGAAFAVSGTYLLVQEPTRIADTSLTRPSRYLGADLLAIGVPLMLMPLYRYLWPSTRTEAPSATVSLTPESLTLGYVGRF